MATRKRRIPSDLETTQTFSQWNVQKKTAQPENERAASCLSHVRALNSQFARWVQQQLEEHPNELWREGLEDYLKHAGKLLEDFKDVVESIKRSKLTPGAPTVAAVGPPGQSSPMSAFPNLSKPDTNQAPALFGFPTASTPAAAGTNSSAVSVQPASAAPTSTAALGAKNTSGAAVPGVKLGFTFGSASAGGLPAFSPPPPLVSFSHGAAPATSSFLSQEPLGSGGFTFGAGLGASAVALPQTFGGPAGAAAKEGDDAANEGGDGSDGEKEPESPSFRDSQLEGISVAFSSTARVRQMIKPDSSEGKVTWKDLGTGDLSIRRLSAADEGTKASQPKLVFRNGVGRLLLNAQLYHKIDPIVKKDSIMIQLMSATLAPPPQAKDSSTSDGGLGDANGKAGANAAEQNVMNIYAIRLRSEDEVKELREVILRSAPKDS